MIYLIDKTNRLQWYNSEKRREEKKNEKTDGMQKTLPLQTRFF